MKRRVYVPLVKYETVSVEVDFIGDRPISDLTVEEVDEIRALAHERILELNMSGDWLVNDNESVFEEE